MECYGDFADDPHSGAEATLRGAACPRASLRVGCSEACAPEAALRDAEAHDLGTLTEAESPDAETGAGDAAAASAARQPGAWQQPAEAVNLDSEALEGLGELRQLGGFRAYRRASSVGLEQLGTLWWETDTTETASDTMNSEYTLDSEDTSVSSTRCSTNYTESISENIRLRHRGARSPSITMAMRGPRGRSMTRRTQQGPGAALRHRHPTHTPSRMSRRGAALGGHHRAAPPGGLAEVGGVGEELAGVEGGT